MNEHTHFMRLTKLLSFFSLNLRAPFCTSTFTLKFLIALLKVHTRENLKNTSPLSILCILMPQIILLLTLTPVYMWFGMTSTTNTK